MAFDMTESKTFKTPISKPKDEHQQIITFGKIFRH